MTAGVPKTTCEIAIVMAGLGRIANRMDSWLNSELNRRSTEVQHVQEGTLVLERVIVDVAEMMGTAML